MKTLPDAPNLDHLRQQAKDVLAQLRVVRPGATLSGAQALIAEQYGFRTWPDLVEEVNRRAAEVRRHDGAAEAVAETFGLGSPSGPLVALERQWAGQAWSLPTDRGRWLVRQLFDWVDGSSNESEVLLAESAAAAGIVSLRPVRSGDGQIVETLNGARWRVYEQPPLGPEPPTPAGPNYAAAAGRIIGRVHGLGLAAPMPPAHWLSVSRSEEQWWALHAAAEAAHAPWAQRLAEVIPTIVDVSGVVEPVEAAGDTVLSSCHWAPNAFRDLVFPVFRRSGLARRVTRLAAEWALVHLPATAVVAVVDEANTASRRVAEEAGFKLESSAEPWEYSESGVMLRYFLHRPA